MKNFIQIFIFTMLLFSCSGNSPKDYADNEPKLDIRNFLNGKVIAHGILEDRKGKVTRRFTVDMQAKWDGNKGVLDEYFTFDDGETSKRVWTIEFQDHHNFTATADDVVGIAKGQQHGNALQMQYVLDLVVDNETKKSYHVTLDDWMHLIDDQTLVNKSKIKKFGITFAKLTIFFKKLDD